MEFPLFQVPYLGNGMTIALNAVLHVIISHGLAIGAVAIVALGEYLGVRKASSDWEGFSRDLLKVLIIIITGVGAVTGAGIWFTISALSPRATGSLLRVFFWPWFIEWLVFTAEVVVLLTYYFTWDRWTAVRKKQHVYWGFSYVFFATLSGFLITGILGFMLTSDGWPWDKSFWSAFFNPSFAPQLLVRFGVSFAIGGMFAAAYLLFSRRTPGFRRVALRLFGKITLFAVLSIPLFTWWYFAVVPSRFKTQLISGLLTSHLSQHPEILYLAIGLTLAVTLGYALAATIGAVAGARLLVIPALLLAFGFVAAFERGREFIRGPYLMPGYLYTNQVLLQENPYLNRAGMLDNAYWANLLAEPDALQQGAFLFAQNCSACHTIGGLNDIRARLKGRSQDGIYVFLTHTNDLLPVMPPFSGTTEERRIAARFLYRLAAGKIAPAPPSRYSPLPVEKGHE